MEASTPPPTPEPEAGRRGAADGHPPLGMGMVPGNAELVVYVLALFVAMLVTWLSDPLGPGAWMEFAKWTTAAYLLSRGIAKASRVFEY